MKLELKGRRGQELSCPAQLCMLLCATLGESSVSKPASSLDWDWYPAHGTATVDSSLVPPLLTPAPSHYHCLAFLGLLIYLASCQV